MGKIPNKLNCLMRKKKTSWNPQNVNHCCTFTEQNKNGISQLRQWGKPQQKRPGRIPTIEHCPNQIPSHGKNEGNHKNMRDNSPAISNYVRKQTHGWIMAWEGISQHLLAQEAKKKRFPKMGNSPNSNLTSIPFPSQGNNFLYQL